MQGSQENEALVRWIFYEIASTMRFSLMWSYLRAIYRILPPFLILVSTF
jgi:hypothetical protein